MEEKLLKTKKVMRGGTRSCASATDGTDIVVVGNYKARQLDWIRKNGVYNWPVREGDEFTPEQFARINELCRHADVNGENGRIALSLISCIAGWKIDEGVYVNRRHRLFGVMASDDQGQNIVKFAVGILIGCKGAKVYQNLCSTIEDVRREHQNEREVQ